MDKTVMNNVEKTININYMILIKLANFEQKLELEEIKNINDFSAEKIIFLHRMFPLKINTILHKLTPIKFKKVITQLMYYYYITKNYEQFDDLVTFIKNKYKKFDYSTDRHTFLKTIVKFYFGITEIIIIDLELSRSCEVDRYAYIPSICLVVHFFEYKNLNISKHLWKNRAQELLNLTMNTTTNKEFVNLLLSIWLQDINWPGSTDIFSYFKFLDNVQFNRFVKNLTKALELFEMSDLIWLDTVINCIANRTDIHNTQLLEELREKSYNQENITKLLNKSIDNIIPPH